MFFIVFDPVNACASMLLLVEIYNIGIPKKKQAKE